MAGSGPDLENRDIHDLNCHVKVGFEEVLAEPESIRSISCVWLNSYFCFECGKNCSYKVMSFLCGLCLAFGWGCEFGLTAFNHVWLLTPCLRDFSICCGCYQKVFGTTINCCLAPVCEACGMALSRIAFRKL